MAHKIEFNNFTQWIETNLAFSSNEHKKLIMITHPLSKVVLFELYKDDKKINQYNSLFDAIEAYNLI